jgi:hypothetical protein
MNAMAPLDPDLREKLLMEFDAPRSSAAAHALLPHQHREPVQLGVVAPRPVGVE